MHDVHTSANIGFHLTANTRRSNAECIDGIVGSDSTIASSFNASLHKIIIIMMSIVLV